MKRTTGALLGLGLVLVGIQFVPVERTNPPVTGEVPAPDDVKAILERSCWDCHSNETVWPWYAHVAPASWLVAEDVEDGRRHANFSAWDRYAADDRDEVMEEVVEVMEEAEMPLRKYTFIHRDAKLSDAERERLIEWARAMRAEIGVEAPGADEAGPGADGEGEGA